MMKSFFNLMLEKQSAVFDRDREQLRKQIRSSCFSNFQPFLYLFWLLPRQFKLDASVLGWKQKYTVMFRERGNLSSCNQLTGSRNAIIQTKGLQNRQKEHIEEFPVFILALTPAKQPMVNHWALGLPPSWPWQPYSHMAVSSGIQRPVSPLVTKGKLAAPLLGS